MGNTPSKDIFNIIVQNLLAKDIDPNNHNYWDELWKTLLPINELFDVLTINEVREIIEKHPNNIKIIFTQAIAQLYQVVETPYPIYFDQAINCTRILTRLLPILLENKNNKVIKQLLWSRRNPISDDNNNAEDSEPLAVILVNTIFHLLFLPDFTIEDNNIEFTEKDINTLLFKKSLMWAPGVGSTEKTLINSTQYDNNRIDVLRLMIATFCDSLYQSADNYNSCGSLWLEVATSVDAPYAEIVFYSLMNTVLGYDPVGWGVPYGNLMSTDTAKTVMEHAIQALIILLDYGHPIRQESNSNNNNPDGLPSVQPNDTEAPGFNIFRRYLSEIDSPDSLLFIYKGIARLLNNTHQSNNTYLPYSISKITIEQELLILLWKCLEENHHFMNYILKNCDITEIIVPICYYMIEGRKDSSKVGLLYLCTFTLLKLSGERQFGVALNKNYIMNLPVDIPLFNGNYVDLIIIVLHKLIVSGIDKLSALYSCFLTIICNISPYCKSLCTISAVKLVNLLQLFNSPRFLYAAEGNHIYVSMLLETLNNIIQYQYEGNGNIIYAVIRRKEIFYNLYNLTLDIAIKHAKDINNNNKVTAMSNVAQPSTDSAEGTANENGTDNNNEDNAVPSPATPTELISTASVKREDKDIDIPDNNENTINNNNTGIFIPTEEWLNAVKAELPLNTIMRLLKHLVPQLEKVAGKGHNLDEKAVTDFLKSTTMVGILPVPHPIVIRKYQPNKFTCLWFTAFLWGVIFMHNQELPLFDGKHVKLFLVQTV